MAQYYHILDYEGLPVSKLAALVAGLPDHSRTKAKINGYRELPTDTILLAIIADGINTLVWMKSEDGANGQNRPKSIYSILMGEKRDDEAETFDTPEEFMAERARLISGKGQGT